MSSFPQCRQNRKRPNSLYNRQSTLRKRTDHKKEYFTKIWSRKKYANTMESINTQRASIAEEHSSFPEAFRSVFRILLRISASCFEASVKQNDTVLIKFFPRQHHWCY